MYIYDLPYFTRKTLCTILDESNRYEELAVVHMQFDTFTVQAIKREFYRGKSPTEELLTLWGQQNHSVLELFVLLSRMKHYQAMTVLKEQVEPKYHYLINDRVPDISELLGEIKVDEKSKKILNVNVQSKENNESFLTVAPPSPAVKPKSPLPLLRTNFISDISVVAESAGAIPQIPYEELRKSTNDWDKNSILGRGGFGTVFKGTWKYTQVAIKRIEQKQNSPESHSEQIKQSITELHCLNTYRHDNVLPLYGYSIGGPQPCLVYQYMSGGCLEHRLHTRDPAKILKWPSRLNISIGTARGLQFLHNAIGDKPLIHGDIKSANILLDPNDMPRIGDFGLAREGPESHYTHIKVSRIHGTRPYLPDEFIRAKQFSTKVDTYSFGVVLFEIGTGLSAYSEKRRERFLKDHVVDFEGDVLELKDAKAPSDEGEAEAVFLKLMGIGKDCVRVKAKERPEMVQVLELLEMR